MRSLHHKMTVESCGILEGLQVEVHYGWSKGEAAQLYGPPEVCHPGSADEVDLDCVLVTVPGGFDPVDIIDHLKQSALDDIEQFVIEHHDDSDPRY